MGLFVLNVGLGLVWMGFSDPSIHSFLIGFIVGAVLISLYGGIFDTRPYTLRAWGFVVFALAFLKAFVVSNLTIAKSVLFTPVSQMEPNIISLDVSDLSDIERLILAQVITLTPGTTSIDFSHDHHTLYLHAFDATDPEAIRESINTELRAPILRFTR